MSVEDLQIRAVATRADDRAFCQFPYDLYRDDPRWAPPLRSYERRRWSARHHVSLRSRWVRRFVARRGGTPVGRAAAIFDEAFASRWSPGTGFFGFFECADDGEACRALLAAAESALRDRGATAILGPVNLTTHDEVGILVSGFEQPPVLLTPYNPPYYPSLLEDAGYEPRLEFSAYRWEPAQKPSGVVARLVRRLHRQWEGSSGLRIRPADPRRWDAENKVFFQLYNDAFEDLWGFVPLEWDEYRERAEQFRPFYRPELALIAEVGGDPVGFGLLLPNLNEALVGLRGRLFPFGWVRLAQRIPKISMARFVLLGVRAEYRGRGIAACIAHEAAETTRRLGIEAVEISVVQDSNREMRHVVAAFGCPRVKTLRLYEKRQI
ncbi:MAG: GNAT family N-acetyltransferase [Planctomycetota bacterium]|nr:GNAT family N-acetyltransferase [Planctomycetota bacterium]